MGVPPSLRFGEPGRSESGGWGPHDKVKQEDISVASVSERWQVAGVPFDAAQGTMSGSKGGALRGCRTKWIVAASQRRERE